MFQKNVAGQHWVVEAFDAATGLQKTGDSAQITIYYQQGNLSSALGTVTAMADSTINESSSTNAKGTYWGNLSQGESNCDEIIISGKSSTGNVTIPARRYNTVAPNMNKFSVDSNGRGDVIKIAGTTQTARDLGTSVLLSSGTGTGQVSLSSGLVDITQTAADKAWSTAARVLTAGTNIQLPSNGLANVTAWTVALTGNITGNLSGAVGSVTGAVGSVTGAVGSVTGAVASVTGNVGGNVVGTVASVVGAVGSVTGNVGGNVVGSVGSVTTVSDKTGYRLSATGVDDVWDEAISGHLTSGTTGAALNGAGSAGDPWSTPLPGAYGAGTAGKIIGDNIDAVVSSRATPAQILTTTLTESYAAAAAVPTLTQAVMETLAMLTEKSVSSTTLTTKKRDGSTTARTYTLNDATTPTAITGS